MKSLVIENSDASSLFESPSEEDERKAPLYKKNENHSRAELQQNSMNLAPNKAVKHRSTSQMSKASDASRSEISNGSYVGSNKVFIPSLNIQKDVIEREIELKRKHEEELKNKREEDKKNPRFQMKRMGGNKKNMKNLIQAKNDKVLNNLKVDTEGTVSDNEKVTESKEFSISGDIRMKSNPFTPLALDLSKVPKKGEPPVPRIKDNSFFENTTQGGNWDVKAITESEVKEFKKDMIVTLGPTSNVEANDNVSIPKSSDKEINKISEFINTKDFNETGTYADIYNQERSVRGIYNDDELHALIIFLIFSLILTPQRGTLDDLYCSRYPLADGKLPVLHFLHFHLNHPENQSLIPLLLKKVEKQFNEDSGVRLLKLLCKTLFDRNLYQDSTLIAKGAYGNVYQWNTLCEEPEVVAIKQMNFPSSIENRCVLYDVFTEVHVASIETLKLKSSIVDIYDYGVDSTGYHLVLKRYKFSLREWRANQQKSLKENLSVYLSLYKDILKAVELLHNNNVTHYDIKADNVFLNVVDSDKATSDSNLTIALGDFGEWKMFISEEDEFCEKNRGTEVIMSPEMFMLAINIRKDTEKYDRRKRMGTNRLSDIWSLGWLFYELLTGQLLFKLDDLYRLWADGDELVPKDKYALLDNNVYLIDFLNFMLVRDPRLRPPISSVIKRFEHVHALLVVTGPTDVKYVSNKTYMTESVLLTNLKESVSLLKLEHDKRLSLKLPDRASTDIPQILVNSVMTINKDIFYWSKHCLKSEKNLTNLNITHIVSMAPKRELYNLNQAFDVLYIDELHCQATIGSDRGISYPKILGYILDFLRKASIRKGKVLFVEEDELLDTTSPKSLVGEYIILALSRILNLSAYETYTAIRTRNPIFDIAHPNLGIISTWWNKQIQTQKYLKAFPTLECMCGACSLILKRQFGNMNNMYTVSWNCTGNRSFENTNCPSPAWFGFISYMRKVNRKVKYDRLKWGYLGREDFILGPKGSGIIRDGPDKETQRQILTASLTIDENCEPIDLVSDNSQDRDNDWKVYKCKYCYVWMYAYNKEEDCFSVLLNNQIKFPRHGILNTDGWIDGV